MGYPDDGEGVSLAAQCADVKNVLGSLRKMERGMKCGGVRWGERHTQSEKTGQKTRTKCEDGHRVMYAWAPSKENDVREESEKILKGNRFAILAMEGEGVCTGSSGARKSA